MIQRGMRDKLDKYLNSSKDFEVEMIVSGTAVYDYCCFGVDGAGKLSDDRYMVFYNQPLSPNNEIKYIASNNGAKFIINLSKLASCINKLVFTVSIDGTGTMGDISSHKIAFRQGRDTSIEMTLGGKDFHSEKAIISVEVYKKDVWRFAAVASGFNGGLGDLLRAYGGEEAPAAKPISGSPVAPKTAKATPTSAAVAPPVKISLKKGERVSLAKNDGTPIIIENGWTAQGKDYDLKALVRYRNGALIYIGAANKDEALQTPEGAVKHGGDIKHPGELEHISISWHQDITSVAVSSYSALENGAGSFHEYGVFMRIKNGKQTIEISAANASADRRSYTLCFGEIIYGSEPNSFEVSALEMYSRPSSENRIGYTGSKVVMDIGPAGQTK
ncbi:MAG: hypothetical protein EOM45_01220 [Clostridia bacterium]|nr:hypothetical protein [Clostridia bacterium]